MLVLKVILEWHHKACWWYGREGTHTYCIGTIQRMYCWFSRERPHRRGWVMHGQYMRQWQTRVRYINRPCAIAPPYSLLQWFGQLVTVPDHNCNCSAFQCIALKVTSSTIEWRVVLIFASVCTCVYCTEQLNAMKSTECRKATSFKSKSLDFVGSLAIIFISVLFSYLFFILSFIYQSSVGNRMSWSNIFDLQRMCREAGRAGPCFYPGGPENLVRPILLFSFHFHFFSM